MYKINKSVLDRTLLSHQTIANNANPQIYTHLQRASLPINSSRYWDKLDCGATVHSIALKRPTTNTLATEIWRVLDNGNGGFSVQKSVMKSKLYNLVWETVCVGEYPENSSVNIALLQFDGKSKTKDGIKEQYTIGETPYLILGTDTTTFGIYSVSNSGLTLIKSIATAIDVSCVRGEYSSVIDDGILIFYIDTDYQLHEVAFKDEEVIYDNKIDMLPDDMPSIQWEKVRANTTFDYRIVLQLKEVNGGIYTLYSRSRPGGDMLSENIGVTSRCKGSILNNKFTQIINVEYEYTTYADYIHIYFDETVAFNRKAVDVSSIYISDWCGRKFVPTKVEPLRLGGAVKGVTLVYSEDKLLKDYALPCTVRSNGAVYIKNSVGNTLEPFAYKVAIDNSRFPNKEREYIVATATGGGRLQGITTKTAYFEENAVSIESDVRGNTVLIDYKAYDFEERNNVSTTCAVSGTLVYVGDTPL